MAKLTPKVLKEKTADAPVQDDTLKRVLGDYENWKSFVSGGDISYWSKWLRFWKLWNNERINPQYFGDSESFEPMTHQIVEAIVDNVYGSRPKLTFTPTDRYQERDTRALNSRWDRTWSANKMDKRIMAIGREQTLTGNTVAFGEWDYANQCMKIIHIPIRDAILDSSATDDDCIRKAGYRRLVMLDELKEAKRFDPTAGAVDPETREPVGAWVPKYKNLREIETWPSSGSDPTDAVLKECYTGSTLPASSNSGNDSPRSKQVEVIYMVYLDKLVEVANRKTTIFEDDTPYKLETRKTKVHKQNPAGALLYDETTVPAGAEQMAPDELAAALAPVQADYDVPEIPAFIPMAMQRSFVDPALLLAKGDVETFAATQEDLNDTLNEKKDIMAYRARTVQYVSKANAADIPKMARAKPGSIIDIADPNGVNWDRRPEPFQDGDIEMARAKQSIRDTARIPEVAQGISDNQDKTATEVNKLMAQATNGYAVKARNLGAGFYRQLGDMFIRMEQIFAPEDLDVRMMTPNGPVFQAHQPSQHWGIYEVTATLEASDQARQSQEADQAMKLKETFNGDPTINQTEVNKIVLEKAFPWLDAERVKLLMTPPPPLMPAGAGMPGGPLPGPLAVAGGAPVAS